MRVPNKYKARKNSNRQPVLRLPENFFMNKISNSSGGMHFFLKFFFFTLMGARKRSRILTANTRVSGYSCSLPWSSVNQRTASSRWAGEMSVSYDRTTAQLNISPLPCWSLNLLFSSIFPLEHRFLNLSLHPFRHSNYIPPKSLHHAPLRTRLVQKRYHSRVYVPQHWSTFSSQCLLWWDAFDHRFKALSSCGHDILLLKNPTDLTAKDTQKWGKFLMIKTNALLFCQEKQVIFTFWTS